MVSRSLLAIVFLISFCKTFAAVVEEDLISVTAGQAGDFILTSREVLLHTFIENALSKRNPPIRLKPTAVRTREFARETTAALVETTVAMEANAFGTTDLNEKELQEQQKRSMAAISKDPLMRSLEYDSREVNTVLRRKLISRKFIRFKMDSADIPVSDKEAQEYFERNRLKFENLPFENFKQNIKSYLAKQQIDRRLKDWFELLQTRYRVRNFLAE